MSRALRLVGWAAFAAAGPVLLWSVPHLPFVTTSHLVFIAITALATTGLGLIMGFAGQVSLGHAAFYGMGGYATAILSVDYAWPPVAGIVVGVAVAALVAAVVARLVFRATEHFLAMATLAFGLIFFYFLQHARDLTGGNAGRGDIPKLAVGPLQFTTNTRMFLLTWALVVLGALVARNVVRSRTGRALQALGTSQVAAGCCGVDLVRAKVGVFVLGAVYAALAGSMYAHHVTYISPDEFGLLQSIQFLIVAIVGGLTSVYGAAVGAVVLILLTELGRDLVPVFLEGATGPYELVIYGLILVVILVFLPRGVAGTISHRYSQRHLLAVEAEGTALEGGPPAEEQPPAGQEVAP